MLWNRCHAGHRVHESATSTDASTQHCGPYYDSTPCQWGFACRPCSHACSGKRDVDSFSGPGISFQLSDSSSAVPAIQCWHECRCMTCAPAGSTGTVRICLCLRPAKHRHDCRCMARALAASKEIVQTGTWLSRLLYPLWRAGNTRCDPI